MFFCNSDCFSCKSHMTELSLIEQGTFFCDIVLLYMIKKGESYREKKFEEIRYGGNTDDAEVL